MLPMHDIDYNIFKMSSIIEKLSLTVFPPNSAIVFIQNKGTGIEYISRNIME